jgi:hypothetical protein
MNTFNMSFSDSESSERSRSVASSSYSYVDETVRRRIYLDHDDEQERRYSFDLSTETVNENWILIICVH